MNKILLMGNPNVGKSVLFTELTGIHAVSSNFAGTTVSYMEGKVILGEADNTEYTLIDVPGTYSLKTTSEAETVAARFIESGADAVVCVLDASNLERNLHLALELRAYDIPAVYALNLLDVAERRGTDIKANLLARELGAPVVPTVAVKKRGIQELKQALKISLENRLQYGQARGSASGGLPRSCNNCEFCLNRRSCDLWNTAKEITARVSNRKSAGFSLLDRLGDWAVKPFPGIPAAIAVTALLIGFVVGVGETLRSFFLEPLVENIIVPFFRSVFSSFIAEGTLLNVLVGEYGVFVIGFEWILAAILPYVFLFYVAFSFLEDSGYLPRISVLFDNVMRKLGVQGGSLIYTLMGFGCAVPAIVGSRAASSRKERIVITTAVCFAVPCVSQTGALISLLSGYALWIQPVLVLVMFCVFITAALVAGKLTKGETAPLIIEVPNLLIPEPKAYVRKLLIRMKHFLLEAELPMLFAVIIAALLKETGALDAIAVFAAPLVSRWLGLPPEAVAGLLLGIIRREMSVAPLISLNLTNLQALVGGVVSLLYLPCLSVFGILAKEFKLKTAVVISVSTVAAALSVGGLVNHIGRLIVGLCS